MEGSEWGDDPYMTPELREGVPPTDLKLAHVTGPGQVTVTPMNGKFVLMKIEHLCSFTDEELARYNKMMSGELEWDAGEWKLRGDLVVLSKGKASSFDAKLNHKYLEVTVQTPGFRKSSFTIFIGDPDAEPIRKRSKLGEANGDLEGLTDHLNETVFELVDEVELLEEKLATARRAKSESKRNARAAFKKLQAQNDELKAELKAKAETFEEGVQCPITREPMSDPVVAADGHTYEKSAILAWFKNSLTSPMTREVLKSTDLSPNHTVKSLIAAMGLKPKADAAGKVRVDEQAAADAKAAAQAAADAQAAAAQAVEDGDEAMYLPAVEDDGVVYLPAVVIDLSDSQ